MAAFGRLGKVRHMSIENVKKVDIKTIIPYENNPRNNKDAVEATANSIKEFGWQ